MRCLRRDDQIEADPTGQSRQRPADFPDQIDHRGGECRRKIDRWNPAAAITESPVVCQPLLAQGKHVDPPVARVDQHGSGQRAAGNKWLGDHLGVMIFGRPPRAHSSPLSPGGRGVGGEGRPLLNFVANS